LGGVGAVCENDTITALVIGSVGAEYGNIEAFILSGITDSLPKLCLSGAAGRAARLMAGAA
jgi:hypothetical protein